MNGTGRDASSPGSAAGLGEGTESSLLRVRDLQIRFRTTRGELEAVRGISLDVYPGEIVAVVGESGSGKSVGFLSALGLVAKPAGSVDAAALRFGEHDLLRLTGREFRSIRGRRISMIFQDPNTSLNPVLPVGRQIVDVIKAHARVTRQRARAQAEEMLARVRIPQPRITARQFPHQLSGGMRQRVLIAMALANRPELVIADEPTTALDVTTQREILDLLVSLQEEFAVGLVLITHDIALASEYAQRLLVMYAGKVVESGRTAAVLSSPRHPYTAALLAALPGDGRLRRGELTAIPGSPPSGLSIPTGCAFHPRCQLRNGRSECVESEPLQREIGTGRWTACHFAEEMRATAPPPQPGLPSPPGGPSAPPRSPITRQDALRPAAGELDSVADSIMHTLGVGKVYGRKRASGFGLIGDRFWAVEGVTVNLRAGETLGIVGESGSGKSTLARLLTRLTPASSGAVFFRGRDVASLRGSDLRSFRRNVQIVFQNPFGSLDPRMTVRQILAEPLATHGLWKQGGPARVESVLESVGLDVDQADRRPHEFSGGQRQRVAIARALVLRPEVVVLDEPVSALDVSVQAQILRLLCDLQSEFGLAYVFISHDLAVVREISDRIAVMYLGEVVEYGSTTQVYDETAHPYTRALLEASPRRFEADEVRARLLPVDVGVPLRGLPGCRLHPRCTRAREVAFTMSNPKESVDGPFGRLPRACSHDRPELIDLGAGQQAACHYPPQFSQAAHNDERGSA